MSTGSVMEMEKKAELSRVRGEIDAIDAIDKDLIELLARRQVLVEQ